MEMSNIPNGGFHPNEQVNNVEQTSTSTGSTQVPAKRKPGRPKGSTKKNITGEPPAPKVKRPVGRPRKDGFPAGSLGSARPRPKQAQTPAPGSWPVPLGGVGYPQHQTQYPHMSASAGPSNTTAQQIPIDPHLEADDWAVLARTNPNAFLTTLLSALAAPNPISSAGPTVEEAFKSHLNSLTPMSNQLQPIPSLYSILKTFWLPSSPAYFSLTASASTARTPSEHRFLYWDPQPLVFNGIACPSCASPLLNRGRISSGPIKIYDIERPFFIIGCEYACRSNACASVGPEGRKFASTDASIFRALPAKLKDEFPARLLYADADAGSGANIWNWGALGVSLSLWNMVRGCLRAGMRKDIILQLVDAVQKGVPEDEHMPADAPVNGVKTQEEGEDDDGGGEVGEHGGEGEGAGSNGTSTSASAGNNASHSQGQGGDGDINPAFVQTFIDAYNDAWKANSGAAPVSSASSAPPTTSTPHPEGTSSTPQQAQTQGQAQPRQQGQGSPQMQSQIEIQIKSPPAPSNTIFDYPTKGFAGYPYAAYPFFPPGGSSPAPPENNLKRPYPFSPDEGGSTSAPIDSSKRSPRHCCKCGSSDCKGKGGRSFCTNGCQDCGKLDCKGRNSRRPDKKCSEGWTT